MLLDKDKQEYAPQKSEEWYKKRKNYITASMIASVCNENPYESRLSALKKKIGKEPPFQGNQATEHGNKFEPVAIQRYEKLTNEKVLHFGLLSSLNEEIGRAHV